MTTPDEPRASSVRVERVLVAVVHPHEVVRTGLQKVVAELFPLAEVKAFARSADLVHRNFPSMPAVVIMELNMRLEDCGLSTLQRLRNELPETRLITLSHMSEKEIGIASIRYGTDAFLPMDVPLATLKLAINTLLAGGRYTSPAMHALLADEAQGLNPHNGFARLSPREMDVIRQLIWGLKLKNVAAKLGLDIRTASCYKRNALAKLGMSSVAEVVRYSSDHGIMV